MNPRSRCGKPSTTAHVCDFTVPAVYTVPLGAPPTNVALIDPVAARVASIVRWLDNEPEKGVLCDGHRHANGERCMVLVPLDAHELADAIARGADLDGAGGGG